MSEKFHHWTYWRSFNIQLHLGSHECLHALSSAAVFINTCENEIWGLCGLIYCVTKQCVNVLTLRGIMWMLVLNQDCTRDLHKVRGKWVCGKTAWISNILLHQNKLILSFVFYELFEVPLHTVCETIFKLQDSDTPKQSRDCLALESAYLKINICMLNWGGRGQ